MIRYIETSNPATKTNGPIYNEICDILGFDKVKKNNQNNFILYPDDDAVHSIRMFYLDYQTWGRLYFFAPIINVPSMFRKYSNKDEVTYESFLYSLRKTYADKFGQGLTEKLIDADNMLCYYVEFISYIEVVNSDKFIKGLEKYNFATEQLDISKFDEYKLKNSYVSFTINSFNDNTIRLCAKCPNTALKKITKIKGLDHLKADKVFDKEFAAELISNQANKFTKPDKLNIFDKINILQTFG